MTRLRGLAADVVRLFDHSPTPIYVLDDRRQIVYCNPACARWIGRRASDVTNLQCEFHPPGIEHDAAAADLCPAPEVFSGRWSSGLIGIGNGNGPMRYRRGQFIPLGDGQDESAPVLVVLEAFDCEPPQPGLGSDAHLHEQVRRFQSEMAGRFQAECLIGVGPAIVQARRQIELAAGSRASVLCLGEVGTGKKQVARTIHYSQLQPGALVPLACGALEPNLLRGTLRSVSTRCSADATFRATLLLEDVDQLCPEAHADVWQLFEFRPGQVRVIATSSRTQTDLEAALANPRLVCALATMTIHLPALRDRPADLPLLAQAFLERENVDNPKQLGGFMPEALDVLAAHAWPGNLDELTLVVQETHARARFGRVEANDLPERIRWSSTAAVHSAQVDEPIVLEELLANLEKELIERAIARARGNKSKAAKLLGLNRPRLYRRLVQLGLAEEDSEEGEASDKPDFEPGN